MRLPRIIAGICTVGYTAAGAHGVWAQNYPIKSVRIIASEAGGGNDFVVRQITPGLSASLRQPVIIDNRGLNGPDIVLRAPADGYTLLNIGSGLWLLPFLRKNVPYDPVKDFLPITLAVSSPGILILHPSVPVATVRELIALAKSRPAQLNYASGATGTIAFLGAELFKSMAGVNFVHVPYKGNGPAITGLIGNEVQLMFATSGASTPHIKSGKVKALAVTGATSSALFPELPTVASSLPGYEAAAMTGLFAPARTPDAVIRYLNREIVRVLNQPEVKERYLSSGVEVVASSPEEFARKIKSEMTRMGKVIRDAGLRED
jgi:tripartite-type tricarboxylate transporter receptor subunit TctC